MKNDIRLVAFDLDGTLLGNSGEISQRTYNVLRSISESGVELIPASGRPFGGIPEEVKKLYGVKYIITTNGAAVYDPDGRLIKETAIERETVTKIINKVDRERTIAAAYINGGAYMEKGDLAIAKTIGLKNKDIEYFRSTRQFVDDLADFVINQERKVQLLTFAVAPEDKRIHNIVSQAVSEYPGLNLVSGSKTNMDVNHRNAGKGLALVSIADMLGIDPVHIAAFGDSGNDRDMLQRAGLKIVMENGDDTMKSEADIIAPSNIDDGVAKVLEHIFEI